ncbi:MAG: cytochrome c peroxidase [Blastocatellia bacterium]|nr:cytochrome c peroxidase [Blastocatellia bacterium]
MRWTIVAAFAAVAVAGFAPSHRAQQPFSKAAIPLGLPADTWDYYVPRNNPMTAAKIELGRKLFFDPRLSADGRISCATCHKPEMGFADGRAVAEGIGGKLGTRNSPTLLNAMFNAGQFWDGRADTLEEQAIQPLTNPLEMGNKSYDEVVARLREISEYREEFRRVFGGTLTIEQVGRALATFERTLIAGDSPFDRFIAGDPAALSEAARRGFTLFRGKARCSRCHTFSEMMPLFTDFNYHNTGVSAGHPNFERLARQAYEVVETDRAKEVIDRLAAEPGGQELGRIAISYQVFDLGAFRTPSLRNIALTAPYFHDGSARTLADVVRFYNEGGRQNINREWDLNALSLTEDEQRDLVLFLESLTGKLPTHCCPTELSAGQAR